MKLYHHPFSANARKALMTAALLEIPVEKVLVDLPKGEQRSPEYRKLNPNGKVPVLVDGDLTLWESLAIMVYLADKHGETPLYPRDPVARADVNRWMFWAAGQLSPQVGVLVLENVLKPRFGRGETDLARVHHAEGELTTLGHVLDAHLAGRTWISGDALTFADIAIACPLMHTAAARLPVQDLANLQGWFGRVQQLEAWKQTELPKD